MSVSVLTPVEQLALRLYDVGAFLDRTAIRPNNLKSEGFILKLHETKPDAPLSPFYMNLRTPENKGGPLTPEVVLEIGQVFYGIACRDQLRYERVVGIPRAGEPFAEAFSLSPSSGVPVPLIYLGKVEEALHREVQGVSGECNVGDTVLVLDDLITRAHTKIEAIHALQSAGLIVDNLIVLVDREQGGVAELQSEFPHLRVHVVFRMTDLLTLYLSHGRMNQSLHDEIMEYLAANN